MKTLWTEMQLSVAKNEENYKKLNIDEKTGIIVFIYENKRVFNIFLYIDV